MPAFLTSPLFIVSAGTAVLQFLGQFVLKQDAATVTTALSPLYVYVAAQAHSQSGQTTASTVTK